MIYITGDTHGDFRRIFDFCMRFETSADDIMIILGDAGINFSGGFKDQAKKDYIATMLITLFCIHGNHEQRPFTIPSYEETEWHGGRVYVEKVGCYYFKRNFWFGTFTIDGRKADFT